MALGASVQPLTNSAASINSRTGSRGRIPSGILDGYPFQDISHILTPIGGTLHMGKNLPPLYNSGYILGISKKLSQRRAVYPVSGVLQAVKLHTPFENMLQLATAPQLGH